MSEDYQTVLATLTEDIEPSAARTVAITACHRLGKQEAEVERLREENERLGEEPAWAHVELMRLRNEVKMQEGYAAEVERLREENRYLKDDAEHAKAAFLRAEQDGEQHLKQWELDLDRLRAQAIQDFERWGAEKLRLQAEVERLHMVLEQIADGDVPWADGMVRAGSKDAHDLQALARNMLEP